ncbi:hypothetical protein RF55_10420 [Lasius niger]|uniref:Uncharacterized protein n=1 Tax=Lasius niger TaxID=67767 RepID=A0A0J7KHF4_LASNI|nr:hypothetical protein RF55_10420 [Lasius niger]
MALTNDNIIRSINELLGDPEYWVEVLDISLGTSKPPPDPAPQPPPPPRPPRIGTVVQRSDHVNRKKLKMLQTPPPPPKIRPKATTSKPADAAPAEQPPLLLMPAGPLPPPPIRVQIEPGVIVEVPHFAVHVSRKYEASQGRWVLR